GGLSALRQVGQPDRIVTQIAGHQLNQSAGAIGVDSGDEERSGIAQIGVGVVGQKEGGDGSGAGAFVDGERVVVGGGSLIGAGDSDDHGAGRSRPGSIADRIQEGVGGGCPSGQADELPIGIIAEGAVAQAGYQADRAGGIDALQLYRITI